MEIQDYFVPGVLLLPLVALLGIFVVSIATVSVLRRRRRRSESQRPAARGPELSETH